MVSKKWDNMSAIVLLIVLGVIMLHMTHANHCHLETTDGITIDKEMT